MRAARWRAVQPCTSGVLRSAFCSMSQLTTFKCPQAAATTMTVLRYVYRGKEREEKL